ncbi:MAG: class I SAM-dependent methyltransferase [Pseudomonadota bacterium]
MRSITMSSAGEQVVLDGVPKTMLWPLWNRAAEQSAPTPLIADPLAAQLVDNLDFDFEGTFGRPNVMHSIRARYCDDLVNQYIDECDDEPIVVSLGDGLDTQQWRISDRQTRWVSVDVPEAIEVRKRLLPGHENSEFIPCSALDTTWCTTLPRGSAPFVNASGLLMYFDEMDVRRLLAMVADYFPKARIFFDTIPPFFSKKTQQGLAVTPDYTAPPMPWGISVDDVATFLDAIPGIKSDTVLTYADPYPSRLRLYHWLSRIGPIRRRLAGGLVVAKAVRKTAHGYVN